MSGGPFAGQVRGPPRFSGPNCRVQLFNYRVRGPRRGRPWSPTRPLKMRVHSYARTRRDASRPTRSTHKNGDQFFPATRRQPRDRRSRSSSRSRERPGRVAGRDRSDVARVKFTGERAFHRIRFVYPLASHHFTLHPRITLRAPLAARSPTTRLRPRIYHLLLAPWPTFLLLSKLVAYVHGHRCRPPFWYPPFGAARQTRGDLSRSVSRSTVSPIGTNATGSLFNRYPIRGRSRRRGETVGVVPRENDRREFM